MFEDRLEARSEVLARLNQDIAFYRRVDAGVGETTQVEWLVAFLSNKDLGRTGVQRPALLVLRRYLDARYLRQQRDRERPGASRTALQLHPIFEENELLAIELVKRT